MRKMKIPEEVIKNKIKQNVGSLYIPLFELLNTPHCALPNEETSAATPKPVKKIEIPPEFKRYERMFKVGCSIGQVKNKMRMNRVPPHIYDKYFEPREDFYGLKKEKNDTFDAVDEEEEEEEETNTTTNTVSRLATSLDLLAQDLAPHLKTKFFTMKEKGVPASVIKKCMHEAGVNPFLHDVFFGVTPITPPPVPLAAAVSRRPKKPVAIPSSPAVPTGPPVPGHLLNFATMQKMGISKHVIQQKMKIQGVNPSEYDRFLAPHAPPPPPTQKPIATPIPPCLQKYKNMLKLGVPAESVMYKMISQGFSQEEFEQHFGARYPISLVGKLYWSDRPISTSEACADMKGSTVAPKKKKVKLPKRKEFAPSKKMRPVFLERLANRRVQRSEFWMDVVNNNFDDVLEIDTAEIEYSMATGKQKLNMSGFWYLGHISNPTVLEVQKGIVIYHDTESRGSGNCKMEHILFDRNWGDHRINISQSQGKSEIDDFIMWNHNQTKESCVWQRYTNVMAVRSFLWESDLELPRLIVDLLQSFLGTKTYMLQREKKKKNKKDAIGVVNSRTIGDAQFALRLYKLNSEERMLEFRDCLLALDENRLYSDFGVQTATIPQLVSFFPCQEELRAVSNLEYGDLLKNPVYQFFHILSTIPNLHQRMENWSVKIEFLDRLSFIEKKLVVFDEGARFWTESESLKLMFGLILKLSNFVNHGSRRGKAFGFHLSTLARLSKDFMNYLIVLADDKYPEALDFVKEFEQLKKDRICDTQFADVRQELDSLKSDLRKSSRISPADQSHHNADKYVELMTKFKTFAAHRVEETEFGCTDIVTRYQQLGIMFAASNEEFSLATGRILAFQQMDSFQNQVKAIMETIAKQKSKMEENMKLLRYQQQRKAEMKQRRTKWGKRRKEAKKEEKPYDFMAEFKKKQKQRRRRTVKHIDFVEEINPFHEIAEMKIILDQRRADKKVNSPMPSSETM